MPELEIITRVKFGATLITRTQQGDAIVETETPVTAIATLEEGGKIRLVADSVTVDFPVAEVSAAYQMLVASEEEPEA